MGSGNPGLFNGILSQVDSKGFHQPLRLEIRWLQVIQKCKDIFTRRWALRHFTPGVPGQRCSRHDGSEADGEAAHALF